MKLADYLKKEINFPDEIIKKFDSLWETNKLPKGYQLLSEGTNSQKVYYVEKGIIRMYYLKNGKDITQDFFEEKSFYVPAEKVFFNEYHPYYLELLEDCVIKFTDYSKIEALLSQHQELNKFVRFIMVGVIKKLSERLCSIQFQTARERYRNLIATYPDILLRAPLGHIASYLGITQQTLSVIRAEKEK
ncbi:Crp/Fnr family transcriptional regulator [Chondrinema litorale]|uniref:Crp/Fnr family transcriptional regulator n=1 Tax=Chondrinema litorale TaxID=2994555 RepID=UPI00254363B8|nr:Crp/Fnr family transcriptional regulator [Chondrinema litorale]UZR98528.1 Crp/Fnr family transcriptional regulator [Chondrinema litorale]